MMATVGKLLEDRPALVARATGALEALVKLTEVDPQRVAAIGYCMGGTIALELARSGAELRGVVTFHGGLSTTSRSEERRVGKECVSTCRSRWSPYHSKKNARSDSNIKYHGINEL